MPHQRQRAFTIPEMLAVVAIIVILLSLLVPVLVKMQVPAKQALCANNNRQFLIATRAYVTDNNQWMPFTNWLSQEDGPGDFSGAGWCYKYPNRYIPIHRRDGALWRYIQNDKIYRCPQDTPPYIPNSTHGITSYLMNGAFSGFGNASNSPSKFIYKAFKFTGDDIMFWEVDDKAGPGYYNDASSFPFEAVTQRHLTGLTVGCVDAHTEWLSYDEYWDIEADDPGRLWCKPGSSNGH